MWHTGRKRIGAMSFANVGFGVSAKIVAGTKAALMMHPIRTLDRIVLFLLMWQASLHSRRVLLLPPTKCGHFPRLRQ